MFQLPSILSHIVGQLCEKGVSDAADFLSYTVSSASLLLMAITISAKQYIGSPIQCMVPAFWDRSWEQFAEEFCFIDGGYYVPIDEHVPRDRTGLLGAAYYQWVPMILLGQALLFHLPSRLWQWWINSQSAVDFEHVLKEMGELKRLTGEDFETRFEKLVEHIVEKLEIKSRKRSHRHVLGFNLADGNTLISVYLSLMYAVVKLLYVFNVIGQFALLHMVISPRFVQWCLQSLGLSYGDTAMLERFPIFPKEILCEIWKRELAPAPAIPYILQCVLMVNQWNERLYLLIGFWLFVMLVVTALSFLFYLIEMLPWWRRRHLRQMLSTYVGLDEEIDFTVKGVRITQSVDDFIKDGLGSDGYLLIRFVEATVGGEMARNLCEGLFLYFQQDEIAGR